MPEPKCKSCTKSNLLGWGLDICVFHYEKKLAYTELLYKNVNSSFSIIVIHIVCSISTIVCSILHHNVLYVLGSVKQMLSCVC